MAATEAEVILRTEAAAPKGGASPAAAAPAGSKKAFGTVTMPDGLVLSYPYMADEIHAVYKENFEDKQYLQHGIHLTPGSTVIDVGANTGVFAIYAAQAVGSLGRVLALEPAPHTLAVCKANVASHAAWCKARTGVSPAPVESIMAACGDGSCSELKLVIYEKFSTINSVSPDHHHAHTAIKTFILTRLEDGQAAGNRMERALLKLGHAAFKTPLAPLVRGFASAYATHLLADRREVVCRMTTVSELIEEKGLSSVQLLKVDVERAELDVLRGVKPDHWPLVKQVAVEVHEDFREETLELLRGPAGYTKVVIEECDPIIGPGMYMIWASRPPCA